MRTNKYRYYTNCVNWPRDDVEEGLSPMIDNGIDITRRTFLKYINRVELADLERSLSYASHSKAGLTMSGDWHVSYHRSKLHKNRVYYFQHSGIEYVFVSA